MAKGDDIEERLIDLIVLKELNEPRIWLKILIRANLLPANRLETLLDECDQLCRIISTSIHTARQSTNH